MSKQTTKPKFPVLPAFTVTDAARELGVTTPPIYAWMADGTLEEMRLAAGKTRIVSQASVLRLKAERESRKAV